MHYGTSAVANESETIPLAQDRLTNTQYELVDEIFGEVGVEIDASGQGTVPHRMRQDTAQTQLTGKIPAANATNRILTNALVLREPTRAQVKFVVTRAEGNWEDYTEVDVPQHGVLYALPIKSAPVFGKNVFELKLSEWGRVASLKYSGGGGGGVAASSLTPLLEVLEPSTTSEQAAEVKAEADLIYQQQRLVVCMANPKDCPS